MEKDIRHRAAASRETVRRGTPDGGPGAPLEVPFPEVWDSSSLSAKVVAAGAQLTHRERKITLLAGRLIVHRIEKGQPLYFHNLEGQDKKSIGQRIRPGGRGYPLRLEAGAELDEWLQANDHVDVLATVPLVTGHPGENVTITLLENLVVLSVATPETTAPEATAEQKTTGPVTVVLLVLPEEAELLHQAETTGKVSLTVRNPDDRTLLQERGWSTHKTLFTRERAKKSQPPAPTDPPPAVPPPAK